MYRKRRNCVLVAGVFVSSFLGCGRDAEVPTDERPRAVYVDTETMQAMVHEIVDDPPAQNPETGQRTLMPGLYCPSCQSWHPVPPPEQINHVPGATKCRKTGAALTANGPWPE